MALDYTVKYQQKIAERFKKASLTNAAAGHDYDFTGARGVKIYTMNTAALADYGRGSTRFGSVTDLEFPTQEMLCTQAKSFTKHIEALDNSDIAIDATAGKFLRMANMMNIKVLAAGSIFLGSMKEPITSTKEGPSALHLGVPFTLRPKALRFDYRVRVPGSKNRIRQNGFSKATTVAGPDYCIAVLYLQKRHEDAHGNITAKRVGTMVVKYGRSTTGWVNGATYTIHYGNITGKPFYEAATMGLHANEYARNSHGKTVLVRETGWAEAGATPTHIVLQFSSSHGGAYVGTVGNTFWVDNVGLVY